MGFIVIMVSMEIRFTAARLRTFPPTPPAADVPAHGAAMDVAHAYWAWRFQPGCKGEHWHLAPREVFPSHGCSSSQKIIGLLGMPQVYTTPKIGWWLHGKAYSSNGQGARRMDRATLKQLVVHQVDQRLAP